MQHDFPLNIKTVQKGNGQNQTVYIPQVIGMQDQHWEQSMNQTIMNQAGQLIQHQIGNMPTQVDEMLGLYEIKNNQRQVLSLSLSNYTYHNHAAHGMTYIKSLTFDIEKKRLCTLKDLFKPGSDYVKRLSAIIQTQAKQRELSLLDGPPIIRPDQDYYIADKALVIYFQLYEITPYVFGFPMFPITVYEIQDIIVENGPLDRMAQSG